MELDLVICQLCLIWMFMAKTRVRNKLLPIDQQCLLNLWHPFRSMRFEEQQC